MKKYAVLVAGGIGTRMNSSLPKQFLLIKEKPILFYTINTFLKAYPEIEIILVLPESFIDQGKKIIDDYFSQSNISISIGGETRFHSVQNGLKMVKDESVVFVHDAVRCLISDNLIKKCFENTIIHGSAIPVVFSKDSVRIVKENSHEIIDRKKIALVQTPQVFLSKHILPSFEVGYNEKFTDEASVVEANGIKVHLIDGEENNIKITIPFDLIFAELIL